MSKKQIHLGLLAHPTGAHPASWLKSDAPRDAATNIGYWRQMASTAERGLFDLFFLADTPAARTEQLNIHCRNPEYMNRFEPLTLLSALAGSTQHIGLGATASTSFYEPYNIARLFASLDHLCAGRAGWNVVTSANDYAARNYGLDKLPPHDDRYVRAREFYKVVESLWDTWEDDAFVLDKARCINFDPEKFHITDHDGKYFKVYGGLNIRRTPQGRPVIIQAGSSEVGKQFAAETAEVVFASDPTLAQGQKFYKDLKGRLSQFGRSEDALKILAGLSVVVGESQAEAQDKYQELQRMMHPDVGRMRLGADLEADLTGLPLDEPVPVEMIPARANFHQAYFNQIAGMIREQKLTLRQLYSSYERGKVTVCGTPAQITDHMMEWIESGAADGFMLSCHLLPDDIDDFVDKVVPELQRRGVYRDRYTGTTLREHLGLERPLNRHAVAATE
ncbi:LLM class flavin-dependent oxidoreductase [Herbaspirillum sp. YR522]|uniref:LLM class flavin-dependent oxidoreductase n=1 Tax=Herbaspirillum sp. YR522 TaxID=1144342 RepID=UPI00026FBC58|nr:LLM class flavin-dependent oxidoreductase [Herbaspirillum sp. YR522]EJN02700.1 FMN-dependent oxidoreductase, nitrilotriacetate monooxygenase family [Herbaspirillum sp. YR522]